jgi:hypothetical protein
MRLLIWTSALLLMTPAASHGVGTTVLFSGAEGGTIRVMRQLCSDDNLYVHHDGTFEMGVGWEMGGVVPPYDGAFGEAFDLGPGAVQCVSLWISQDGWNAGQSTDVYVWEDGVTGTPGGVLALVSGIVFQDIPIWPDGGRYDVEIPVAVSGAFTVGSWGNWPDGMAGYGWLADLDGPAGFPWTHVAEGIGWPAGWQNPSLIFAPIQSMGIGVHFVSGSTPAESATWGEIKHLFVSAP